MRANTAFPRLANRCRLAVSARLERAAKVLRSRDWSRPRVERHPAIELGLARHRVEPIELAAAGRGDAIAARPFVHVPIGTKAVRDSRRVGDASSAAGVDDAAARLARPRGGHGAVRLLAAHALHARARPVRLHRLVAGASGPRAAPPARPREARIVPVTVGVGAAGDGERLRFGDRAGAARRGQPARRGADGRHHRAHGLDHGRVEGRGPRVRGA